MSGWILLVRDAASAYPEPVSAANQVAYNVTKALDLGLVEFVGKQSSKPRGRCNMYRATERGIAFAEGRISVDNRPGPKPNGRPRTELAATWLQALPQFTHSEWQSAL